jgi:hypothetical protein
MPKECRWLKSVMLALFVCAGVPLFGGISETCAQSELDLRGSFSVKVSKGKLSFRVGELANLGTPGVASGRVELAVWLSKQPYSGPGEPEGTRLAKCSVDGVVGGEAVANLSCSAKLRLFKRGRYYVIITVSELEAQTGSHVVRDSFTFSKRLKW